MKLGVVFPQTEIGVDPIEIRDYVQAVEEMGYDYLSIYEHVSGIKANKAGWEKVRYTHQDTFHDPLVLFGYLAGFTEKLRFLTSILVLPSRQTLLVAKQTAQVDVLTNGRLDLGVAVGWNPLEYKALGVERSLRGDRLKEQIHVLRELWTKPYVDFKGRFHCLDEIGINPRPVQRPIPIWMGGTADAVVKRAVELCDGWLPPSLSPDRMEPFLEKIDRHLAHSKRDKNTFGIRCRVKVSQMKQLEDWTASWKRFGVTHMEINTMDADLTSMQQHFQVLEEFSRITVA